MPNRPGLGPGLSALAAVLSGLLHALQRCCPQPRLLWLLVVLPVFQPRWHLAGCIDN